MGLEYYSEQVPEGKFKLSPSSIGKYLENSLRWYKDHILFEKSFEGNTETVLGTVVHYLAECYVKGEEADEGDMLDYIKTEAVKNPDVDANEVINNYQEMYTALYSDYLCYLNTNECIAEQYVRTEYNEFIIAGSIDLQVGNKLIDYKTTKRKPSDMSTNHFLQLLVYTWIKHQNNEQIDSVEVIYIVKATKTLPSRVFSFKRTIEAEDLAFIDKLIKNMYKAVKLVEKDKELLEVVFRPNPSSFYN